MATKPTYEQLEATLRRVCDVFAKEGFIAIGMAMYEANQLLFDIDATAENSCAAAPPKTGLTGKENT